MVTVVPFVETVIVKLTISTSASSPDSLRVFKYRFGSRCAALVAQEEEVGGYRSTY